MKMNFICRLKVGFFFLLCVTGIVTTVSGQGIMFSALGPVNRGMAGASVAAPVDAIGSLHWNPAAISGLGSSELSAGLELILPNIDATSTSAPALGGTGTTGAEPGVIPSPSVGWVHQSLTNPRLTYGLGIYSIAGFQTNYPSDPGNPVLNPALFGRVFSSAEFLQIVPTMSYAVTERLSIGFAPTLTMGRIEVSPFVLAPPVPPVPGAPYSSGQGNRWHWGGGAQLGLYYIADNCWHLGASIKSPQWFEKFRFHSEDPTNGAPRVVSTELELPMIISVGAAYSGYENLILAMDVRYFGYEDTKLFGDAAAFAANGQLLGLGWDDVISVALGAQYRLNDCTYVRAGYSYNTNPVGSANAGINVATPLIYEHVINFGMSRQITDCVALNLSFTHAVDNTVSGPLVTPVGVLGGISHSLSVYTVAMGATVRY